MSQGSGPPVGDSAAPGHSVTGVAGPYWRSYKPDGPLRPSVESVSVAFYTGGRQYVLWPHGWHPSRPSRCRRPFAVAEVVLGQHRTDFHMALPAASSAAFFEATVSVVWSVYDPMRVAVHQVRDISVSLRPELEQRLSDVTMRWPIQHADGANAAIRAELARADLPAVGAEVGLVTRIYVRLYVDAVAREAANEVRKDDYAAVLLDRRQQRFKAMLAEGDYAQAAWLAAQNRDNLNAAISMLYERNNADLEQRIGLLRHMMDANLVSPRHLDREVQVLLDWIHTSGRMLLSHHHNVQRAAPATAEHSESRQLSRTEPAAEPAPRLTAGPPADGRGRRGPEPPTRRTCTWDQEDPADPLGDLADEHGPATVPRVRPEAVRSPTGRVVPDEGPAREGQAVQGSPPRRAAPDAVPTAESDGEPDGRAGLETALAGRPGLLGTGWSRLPRTPASSVGADHDARHLSSGPIHNTAGQSGDAAAVES